MKKLTSLIFSIIAVASMLAAIPVFADQKQSLTASDKKQVFDQLLSKLPAFVQKETRDQYEGSVEKYLEFTPINLAKDKQTFWVSGNSTPFVGANKSDCWLYEKSGGKMRQLLDFELCEGVSPIKTKHHGYFDVVDNMHIGAAGHPFLRVFQFDGKRYKENLKRRRQ